MSMKLVSDEKIAETSSKPKEECVSPTTASIIA